MFRGVNTLYLYRIKTIVRMKTLEDLIEESIIDVKYYSERLKETECKLDAFYTARDVKADAQNLRDFKADKGSDLKKPIHGFEGTMDILDDLINDIKNIRK